MLLTAISVQYVLFLNEIENQAEVAANIWTVPPFKEWMKKKNIILRLLEENTSAKPRKHLWWTYHRIFRLSLHCRVRSQKRYTDHSNAIWQYLYSSVILTNWVISQKWGQGLHFFFFFFLRRGLVHKNFLVVSVEVQMKILKLQFYGNIKKLLCQ